MAKKRGKATILHPGYQLKVWKVREENGEGTQKAEETTGSKAIVVRQTGRDKEE